MNTGLYDLVSSMTVGHVCRYVGSTAQKVWGRGAGEEEHRAGRLPTASGSHHVALVAFLPPAGETALAAGTQGCQKGPWLPQLLLSPRAEGVSVFSTPVAH